MQLLRKCKRRDLVVTDTVLQAVTERNQLNSHFPSSLASHATPSSSMSSAGVTYAPSLEKEKQILLAALPH
jgi:hypothetical protein